MNQDLAAVPPHRSKAISDAVRRRDDVIDLTVGEPSFPPPEPLLRQASESLAGLAGADFARDNRYADARGVAELREAVARRYANRYGFAVDPDREVLVTHGAAEAIWLAVFVTTNRGDAVVLPDPGYILYGSIVAALGRRPVPLGSCPVTGVPDLEALAAIRDYRLVVVNSPANPTGAVIAPDVLREVAGLAAATGAYVLHDEVFDDFVFDGVHRPVTAVADAGDHCVLANSFSKRYAVTGWRLGWLVASAEVVAAAAKAHTFSSLAVWTIGQRAAAASLDDPDLDAIVRTRSAEVARRAAWISGQLTRVRGVDGVAPSGGFYVFPDVSGFAARLGSGSPETAGEQVAAYLLDQYGIAVVPGVAFGERGADHVRMSFVGPPDRLAEALGRMGWLS